MLAHLTILFPCMISVLWFLVFFARSSKDPHNGYLAVLAALASAYFFFDACYIMDSVSYRTLIMADIVRQFAAPSLGLFCWYYLRILRKDYKDHTIVGYSMAIPAIMMALCAVVHLIMGYTDAEAYLKAFDEAGHFPEGFDEPIYEMHLILCRYLFVAVEVIICVCLEIYIIRDIEKTGGSFKKGLQFLFKGGYSSCHHIQCCNFALFILIFLVRIILGRCYFIHHLYMAMILSVAIGLVSLFIAYVGILGNKEKTTFKEIFTSAGTNVPISNVAQVIENNETEAKNINDSKSNEDNTTEEDKVSQQEEEEDIEEEEGEDNTEEEEGNESEDDDEEEESSHGAVIKYDESLVDRFKNAVEGKKLFLQSGLTVKDVCSEIGSNKTYISKMVNEKFGMPFPNYINMLRVEYAKEYILAHPDAKQEEIADESGFPNAAGFNRSFKKVTGMTPKIWLAKNKRNA